MYVIEDNYTCEVYLITKVDIRPVIIDVKRAYPDSYTIDDLKSELDARHIKYYEVKGICEY